MGSAYAGVLGFLAFAVVVARGVIDRTDASSTLQGACLAMAVFAVVGLLAGKLADAVVNESVEQNLRAEIEAHQQEAGNKD